MDLCLKKERFLLIRTIFEIGLSCVLIVVCSQIRVPFYPVPFTLQTVAIFVLALTQSPQRAFAAVATFLLCATLGMPVFGGHANPFWILGKSGGYLIGFAVAAYLTSFLKDKVGVVLALLCGHIAIYLLGFIWLSVFIGPFNAWTGGVLFFIPLDLFKCMLAFGIATLWKKVSNHDQ